MLSYKRLQEQWMRKKGTTKTKEKFEGIGGKEIQKGENKIEESQDLKMKGEKLKIIMFENKKIGKI